MTWFDIFNLTISVVVFLLTGWVSVNLVRQRKSWFLILFFGIFAEASAISLLAFFITMPEWIWLLKMINALVWIGAFIGLIYESNKAQNDK